MGNGGYITFPKLPFPMARNIWKWSKFTVKRKREGEREREPVSIISATFQGKEHCNTELMQSQGVSTVT